MIYFIETQGHVKIGYSNDPQRRFSNLTIGCPTKCTLAGVIEGNMADEKAIHERFKANKVRGEWFEFTTEIRAFMAERAVEARIDVSSSGNIHPLAQYLDANSIRVTEFAGRIGIKQAAVSRYVNGKRFPTPEIIRKIDEATNSTVTANDLLRGFEAAQAKRAKENVA